jgi:hypothetical protein
MTGHTGDWLKLIDPANFEHQIYALFRLGHFVSDKYPAIDNKCYANVKRDVTNNKCDAFKRAVANYQSFNCKHLPLPTTRQIDGDFGPMTQNTLRSRMCGVPDVMPSVLTAGSLNKWRKSKLTVWHDMTQLNGVPFALAQDVYLKAWLQITEVCGMDKVGWGSDPDVYAHARRIDGPGRTIAWSYLPSGSNYTGPALEQRFDTGENFAGREWTFLLAAACHENCHAVGLGHSQDPNALMYPQLNGTLKPDDWDIRQLQNRYGRPPTEPDPDPDPDPPSDEKTIKDGDQVTISGVLRKASQSMFR